MALGELTVSRLGEGFSVRTMSLRNGTIEDCRGCSYILNESVELWNHYTDICLHPDYKIAAKHATRISNSLKIISKALFESCPAEDTLLYLEPLLRRLEQETGEALFALIDGLFYLPMDRLSRERLAEVIETLLQKLAVAEEPLRVVILRRLDQFWPHSPVSSRPGRRSSPVRRSGWGRRGRWAWLR